VTGSVASGGWGLPVLAAAPLGPGVPAGARSSRFPPPGAAASPRERVTGIEPAFSAWEIVLAEPVTWAFSRSTWSEYPCGPVGFGSCCLVPVSCGTDMARRGVPWAVGQKQLMFAGRSGGDVIEGRCRLRWHLGERRRVRRRSLFAGSLLTPATRAGLAEWQAEVSRVDRV